MKLRTSLRPRAVGDAAGFTISIFGFLSCYWFHVCISLPYYFRDIGSAYELHLILFNFVFCNAVANYAAVFLTDTSCAGVAAHPPLVDWRYCEACERRRPPGSWHCEKCGDCIAKRDHHCYFISCCIGAGNRRYFVVLLFYMFVGSVYWSYFALYFIWNNSSFRSYTDFFKVSFPLAAITLGVEVSSLQFYRFIIIFGACGTTALIVAFFHHFSNMLEGRTSHEARRKLRPEYTGSALENIKSVMGERWYFTFLHPLTVSAIVEKHSGETITRKTQ